MTHRLARTLCLATPALAVLFALSPDTTSAQRFRRPVTCDDCISDFYYFDHGGVTDWNCGRSTYQDHRGSDFSLRFGNRAIEAGNEVVAMAAGVVRHTEDGYFDQCTQCGGANCGLGIGDGFANQVYIDHGEHTVIYGHMRMGSIMVSPGDEVTCGQVIGHIGSSGCSTGAHLHVEPRPLGGNYRTAFDPFEGACSPTEASLWVDQGASRSLPATDCDFTSPGCPADSYSVWTCTADASARRRCIEGDDVTEPCPYGCEAMPLGTDDECALPPDADGDAARADVDCDDQDATRHPGAVEVCDDGLDQDCSGADEPCPPADVDQDGSPEGIDCDDGNAAINPGAIESCGDGIDQDCNGVDAMCMAPDADADGVAAGTDCNDGAAAIRPGAAEICGDGVDQNCDGVDPPCGGASAGAGASPGSGGSVLPPGSGRAANANDASGDCSIPPSPGRGAAGPGLALLIVLLLYHRRSSTIRPPKPRLPRPERKA